MMVINNDNIFCGGITPPEFTAEQIAKCKQCRHISKKGKWCGHFGVWIREGKIITLDKRILRPSDKVRLPIIPANKRRPCDEQSITNDYEATKKTRANYPAIINGQLKFISLTDYIRRRTDCYNCDELACPVWRGCCGWMGLIYENAKCPKGKWV